MITHTSVARDASEACAQLEHIGREEGEAFQQPFHNSACAGILTSRWRRDESSQDCTACSCTFHADHFARSFLSRCSFHDIAVQKIRLACLDAVSRRRRSHISRGKKRSRRCRHSSPYRCRQSRWREREAAHGFCHADYRTCQFAIYEISTVSNR